MQDASEQVGWLRRDSIGYHAAVRPGKLAVIEFKSGARLGYAELDTMVAKATGWLIQTLGTTLGERVAYLGRNSIDQLAVIYGCHRSGAIIQSLNWRLTGRELSVLIEDAEPAILIYEAEFEAAALEALALSPVPGILRISENGTELTDAIAASAPAQAVEAPDDAPFILLYTSGTTGKPKGAVITRLNAFYGAVNFSAVGSVTPSSVMLCDAPMFHTVGLMAVTGTAMFMGATLAISDRFLPGPTLERLTDKALGITHYFSVPQIAQMLREHPDYAKSDLTNLTALFTGGAPMPPALVQAFLDDGVVVANGYGMTEVGTVMHMPLDRGLVAQRLEWTGVPGPCVTVRIMRQDGTPAPNGEAGELWIKGPGVMPGYWRRPEETAKAFVDGWFRSGDAGLRDDQGFFRLIDRWKDMYISGGENVYPAEVEAVLASVPGVAEVAVVGCPDERWGEIGCAFVVAVGVLEEAVIFAACEGRLARYKQPRLVRFVDSLPRTGSGKVQKDVLRKLLAE